MGAFWGIGLAGLIAAAVGLLLANRRGALVPSRGRDTIGMAKTLWDLWKSNQITLAERVLIFGGIAVSHTFLIIFLVVSWTGL